VEQVSWDDCQGFLRRINERIEGLSLVLPSESQWEYACRAGSDTAVYTGRLEIEGKYNAPALDPIAWYGGNSGVDFGLDDGHDSSDWPEKQYTFDKAGTHPVGRKAANPWGLYDMLGNIWEWTGDTWHADYQGAPEDGSVWDDGEAGAERVFRGGSWRDAARNCRSACRSWLAPVSRDLSLGFRPARVQP
jgi:formylglycine-generating enzyme required for sulfatase activity